VLHHTSYELFLREKEDHESFYKKKTLMYVTEYKMGCLLIHVIIENNDVANIFIFNTPNVVEEIGLLNNDVKCFGSG
jgi:hypothetical protein